MLVGCESDVIGMDVSPDARTLATIEHNGLAVLRRGMSRAPAIAAFALARIEQRSPAESLEQIRSRHGTDVSPAEAGHSSSAVNLVLGWSDFAPGRHIVKRFHNAAFPSKSSRALAGTSSARFP